MSTRFLRKIVSGKKVRYQDGEFDLDLTFITERVIAMGFPSTSLESLYRNNLEDVQKFLRKNFKEHYRVYNLCSERTYDPKVFDNNVENFPFDDHNPPPLIKLYPLFEKMQIYLRADVKNIVVVHCKV